MAVTYKANIIDPQVIADFIDQKLVDNIVFAPLAEVDLTLNAGPGSILSLPKWSYIGNAATVAEGSDIDIVNMAAEMVSVPVHKIAKGTGYTDEAALAAFGDLEGEAARQLLTAISSGVDNEFLSVALASIASEMTFTASTSTIAPADVNGALELFGEDIEGTKVLVCPPALATQLRATTGFIPASEIAANIVIRGTIGEVYGCQIVVSNKLTTTGNAYIVKPGALRLILKRGVMVESDRNIINKTTVITADEHFATYLYNPNKAVKIVGA